MRYLYILNQAIRISARFPLRTLLVASSAALGVAGVIASANYAAAGRQQVAAQIRRLGTAIVTITPRQDKSVAGRPKTKGIVQTLRPEDARALLRQPNVIRVSEVVSAELLLKTGDLSKPQCPVIGCDPAYFAMKDWPVECGRVFTDHESRRLARVVILGHQVARTMFPQRDPLGSLVTIDRVPFAVIGVLSERGQGLDSVNEDAQVYIPASTALARLMNRTYLNAISVQLASEAAVRSGVDEIQALMRRRHRPRAGMPVDFIVQTQQKTIETLALSSRRLTTLVRAVGATALLVSGFGIFGLCGISVRSRTRELGLRRALGAMSSDILLQILLEAACASLLGVAVGFALGPAVARWSELRAGLPARLDTSAALLVTAISILLNLFFSYWPAAHAARIDPIAALRTE